MLEGLRARLTDLKKAPTRVAREAAPLIKARLQRDARSKRGRTPEGIAVEVRPQAIVVRGPEYVIEKAKKKGQIEIWKDIVRETASRILRGG